MFKPSYQSKAKSPYQAKLIQHLIDSDDDSDNDQFFKNYQQSEDENQDFQENSNTSRFNTLRQDKRSDKSFHTVVTQPTVKQIITKHSNQSSKVNSNNTNIQLQKTTKNKSKFSQPHSSISMSSNNNTNSQVNQSMSRQNKSSKASQSPLINIKYDTLKLSEYNSDQIKKHQELYQKNIKDFRQRFSNSNLGQKDHLSQQNSKNSMNLSSQVQQNQGDQYIDSLDAIKKANQSKGKHLLKGNTSHEIDPPSSRIKFLQNIKQPLRNDESQNQDQSSLYKSQISQLKQQLKRSKDVIKTLGLKNTDLQKSLQMKNIKLKELESQPYGNSRISQNISSKFTSSIQKQIYEKVNRYMKERVKEFMTQIQNIKMSPVLEQGLQNFLAQILQLNVVSVNKKLGINSNQIEINQKPDNQPLNLTPNRLNKSIFNTKSIYNQLQNKSQFQGDLSYISSNNNYKNKFQTVNTQSHITIGNRQNAFINNKLQGNKRQTLKNYTTVKLDLSSNKQNVTPNKVNNKADEQFKLLQKSLQKLKTMQKQLHSPIPKNKPNKVNTEYYYSRIEGNQQFDEGDKKQYYLTNKSNFYYKQQSTDQLNLSNNADRSKSRRKKIFG